MRQDLKDVLDLIVSTETINGNEDVADVNDGVAVEIARAHWIVIAFVCSNQDCIYAGLDNRLGITPNVGCGET